MKVPRGTQCRVARLLVWNLNQYNLGWCYHNFNKLDIHRDSLLSQKCWNVLSHTELSLSRITKSDRITCLTFFSDSQMWQPTHSTPAGPPGTPRGRWWRRWWSPFLGCQTAHVRIQSHELQQIKLLVVNCSVVSLLCGDYCGVVTRYTVMVYSHRTRRGN